MGIFGALVAAGWLGIPARRAIDPIEIAIIVLLVGIASFTAWRFYKRRGWIAGPVLTIALIIEATKRIGSGIRATNPFSVYDAVIATLILFALITGIRGARAIRDAGEKPA